MADSGKRVICILSTIILCAEARAITDDSANPYNGIVERNVFGLKPPTPPPPVDTKKTDLSPITLTGVTTILSSKRALFNLQTPGKPVQSFILAEGQRDGDIEVLEIDEKGPGGGSVKIKQSGTIQTLTFDKNGVKLPASVAVAAPNPLGSAPNPQPAFVAPNPYVPAAGRQTASFNTTQKVPVNSGTPAQVGQAGGISPGFGATPGQAPQPVQQQPQLSREEGVLLLEVNHRIAVETGDDTAKIFPPTELDPTRNVGSVDGEPSLPGQQQPQQQNQRLPFSIPGNPSNLPRLPQ